MLTIPTTQPELRDLILRSLHRDYLSHSCLDQTVTGNCYQSVALDGMIVGGFRDSRSAFLDRLVLTGKKVLDLGSNLGELSRGARARGARLVDGYEYDPYFLEIAHMLNAFHRTTRVSFFQHDITDASIYTEHYDVVFAFSVFIYIRSVLEAIASITADILVLETHKLDNNLKSTYLDPIAKVFPSYRLLGESEWGTPHVLQHRRAVLVFAKDDTLLASVLRN